MTVTVAKSAGFCFGVSRAVSRVYQLSEPGHPGVVCTVGSLIHNPRVAAELRARGVTEISPEDFESVFSSATEEKPVTVVIRTHGVSRAISEALEKYAERNPFFTVCDMTCPYVKKIHRIVSENREKQLIVFGNPRHPEVEGIRSYSDSEAWILSSPEEAENLPPTDRPVLAVAQTTQNTAGWKKCKKNIEKVCTNATFFDTICNTTEERQREAGELAKAVDVMLVVGGKESSNSFQLYETAKRYRKETLFIEGPEELSQLRFTSSMKVGITAGASTPGGIIQEVIERMSELEAKNPENGEAVTSEDFAGMLENSLKTLNTGDTVSGVITSVSAAELHVDLGTKVTGIIPFDEVTDDTSLKLTEAFKPGDEIEAIVVKVSDRDGVATLSKKRIDSRLRWKKVLDAYKDGTVIEGTVTSAVKGGVLLEYESNRIFVPASQTGVPKSGDMASLVGTTARAKIIEVNEGRRRAVASIRRVKSEERKQKEAEFWSTIEEGQVFEGPVKSITSFGAFVDLGAVDGMVHSSELSWTRIKNPSEVVSVGQVIRVYVKSFDPEAKRVSLGYKTEETNPWNIFRRTYGVGDVAEVRVVSLMAFGAFAEVVPGVDGLIHISQIADHKIAAPADVLAVGQRVHAMILGIDDERHQISLSIRALLERGDENPYSTDADESDTEADGADEEATEEVGEVVGDGVFDEKETVQPETEEGISAPADGEEPAAEAGTEEA